MVILITVVLNSTASYKTFLYALSHLFFIIVLSRKVGQTLLSPLYSGGNWVPETSCKIITLLQMNRRRWTLISLSEFWFSQRQTLSQRFKYRRFLWKKKVPEKEGRNETRKGKQSIKGYIIKIFHCGILEFNPAVETKVIHTSKNYPTHRAQCWGVYLLTQGALTSFDLWPVWWTKILKTKSILDQKDARGWQLEVRPKSTGLWWLCAGA